MYGSESSAGRLALASACALCAAGTFGCPQLLPDDFDRVYLDAAGAGGRTLESPNAGATSEPQGGAGGASGSPSTQDAGASPLVPVESVTGRPVVTDVIPADGALGVAPDASIAVRFNEPMDRTSVEAAYSSDDIPSENVTFRWSEGDTLLEIVPVQPLQLAVGNDPATTSALGHSFSILETARDSEGEALVGFASSFSTLREIEQAIGAAQDRNLTGNFRSDNVYGDNSCQFTDSTTTCIGDSSNGDTTYRGFVSFHVAELPAGVVQMRNATLRMTIDNIRNSPFPDLGNLVAERIVFSAISFEAFEAPSLGPVMTITSSAAIGTALVAEVTEAVEADLDQDYTQFRLGFDVDTDSDGVGDLVQVLSTTQQLDVRYWIP